MALKENYRELLLDAVVRVAARDGLDRTTTKLIAAEVPCNEVYIYRNFGSKDGLLQAAFNRTDMRFVQTVLKNLDVMDKPGQPLEKLQMDTERDNYMSAQQAKEYGLIDEVIAHR